MVDYQGFSRREFNSAKARFRARIWASGDLSSTEKLVGTLITEYANYNEDGRAWPGHDHIAEALQIHERTARRATKSLRRRRWLTLGHQGGRGRTNEYCLNFERDEDTGLTSRTDETNDRAAMTEMGGLVPGDNINTPLDSLNGLERRSLASRGSLDQYRTEGRKGHMQEMERAKRAIVKMLGRNAWQMLMNAGDEAKNKICYKFLDGKLTARDIAEFKAQHGS